MIGVGDAVPQATVRTPEPSPLHDQLGDGPALLVFFKESCATTQIGMPVFQQWKSQISLIGVSQDDRTTTERFFDEAGIAMPVVYDAPDFEASSAFDIVGVPALFLVEDGVVTWNWVGWSLEKAAELAERIATLSSSEPLLEGTTDLPPFRPG